MLVALLVPVVLIYGYFYWQELVLEQSVALRMENKFAEKELVILTFSIRDANQPRWEHDHEFEYLGMMYDVMDYQVAGDSIYYQCWPDHEESQLKMNLYRALALDVGENPDRKKQESRIFSFLKSMISSSLGKTPDGLEISSDQMVSPSIEDHFRNRHIRPPTPPPKLS